MCVCGGGVVSQANRKDLTHLKVYAIDVDEADEASKAMIPCFCIYGVHFFFFT